MTESNRADKEFHAMFDRMENRVVAAVVKNGDAINNVRVEVAAIANQVNTNKEGIATNKQEADEQFREIGAKQDWLSAKAWMVIGASGFIAFIINLIW